MILSEHRIHRGDNNPVKQTIPLEACLKYSTSHSLGAGSLLKSYGLEAPGQLKCHLNG